MADATQHSDMTANVRQVLKSTPYAPADLKELSGGTANFIYRATLQQPLPDSNTHQVLVKHGQGYAKNSPGFKLTTSRCRIEQECLKSLSDLCIAGETDNEGDFKYTVRTPQALHFDTASNTQVHEYLADGIDLKNYALAHFPADTPESHKAVCVALGKAVGQWLRGFHDWCSVTTAAAEGHEELAIQNNRRADLRVLVAGNTELQRIKHTINFEWLQGKPDLFPNVLGEDTRQIFSKVRDMAARELEDESQLQVIHGDFWSGNVLLPDKPIKPGEEVPVFVVDWEMAQLGKRNLDLGQMIAELYELWLYKSITAGLWIIQGFMEGYGTVTEESAFRTAIQTGAHLVCFGTSVAGWGTPEQVEMVAKTGKELIMHAWKKDREWFENGELACLLSRVQ